MEKECTSHLAESITQLKKGKLKITKARLSLLDIFKHAKKPLSMKEASTYLGEKKVDLVTLYRTVQSLEELGLIKQIRLENRQAYYELAGEHHHHLVCETCSKIRDVKMCNLDLSKTIIKNSGFASVKHHSLEFFGTCKVCSRKK